MRKTGEEWVVADRIRAPFDVVGDLAVAWLDGEVRTFRRDPGVSDDREAQEVVFPIKDALGKAYPPERIGERWELSDLFVGYADLNRDGRDEILYYITNPSGACDREHACGAGVLSQVPENYYPKRRLGVDDSWADLGGVVDDYWPCEPDTPDCRRLYIIERDGRSDLPYHGLRGAWQSYELKVYYYLPSCWPGCL